MSQKKPLYDTLIKEAQRKTLRMHMPGHKGKVPAGFSVADVFAIDFTELDATGNLYEGLPPISEAEQLMAEAVGAADCLFLTGGSTQGIMTAMSLACPIGSAVLVDRGSHRSVWSSLVHLDLKPYFLYAKRLMPWDIAAPITPEQVEEALQQNPQITAVIITSPTFYGVLSDIRQIAQVTHKHGVPLLVDEAHGAHLPFLSSQRGAIAQGANLAVASAHKTLPALTAGAFLFADGSYDMRQLRRRASMFGTSSPAYPVMASMDVARAFMTGEGKDLYNQVARHVCGLRQCINAGGIFKALAENADLHLDPTRLTVDVASGGIDGYKVARLLDQRFNIVCEMADQRNIVMIITCMDSWADLQCIEKALAVIRQSAAAESTFTESRSFPRPEPRLTPRQAAYAEIEYLTLSQAAGRIAGQHLAPYPPGIPVVAAGELISSDDIDYLRYKKYDLEKEIAVII